MTTKTREEVNEEAGQDIAKLQELLSDQLRWDPLRAAVMCLATAAHLTRAIQITYGNDMTRLALRENWRTLYNLTAQLIGLPRVPDDIEQ